MREIMEQMEKELLENIKNSISETVKEKKIGIAFSGGVDSTLVSKICSDMNYDITLLTIGFPESHDILFAKQVNEYLNHPHHILEIDHRCLFFLAFKTRPANRPRGDFDIMLPLYNSLGAINQYT